MNLSTTQVQAEIDARWDDFLPVLDQLMQVESVKGPAAAHAPFGVGPKLALSKVVQIGKRFGFDAGIVNDAMAYVQWGEGQDYIGVVGHLDVVASGPGWNTPAYALTQVGETLYGRGVLDNKGPSMACLFGMKLLRDLGFRPNTPLRLIFGSDEESGSSDVPLYLADQKPPRFGFTPDCKYPVVYGERGIVNYTIDTPFADADLTAIEAIDGDMGRAFVPDRLTVTVAGHRIEAHGVRSPSNAPEQGVNAITEMAKQAVHDGIGPTSWLNYCQWLVAHLADQHFGQGVNLGIQDADSGKLIITPYALKKTPSGLQLAVAIRYPVTFSETDITARLSAALPPHATLSVVRSMPGVLHDQTRPEIQALSKAYADVTGLDAQPVTTTGATYARAMPNIVAFGPSFPGQKGIAHKENEWMTVADLKQNMAIYMLSMAALSKGE